MLSGCTNYIQQQLYFTDYPEKVSQGESFDISAEYITREPSKYDKIEIWLTVKEIDNENNLYSEQKIIEDKSQQLNFENIVISEINKNVYFELRLIAEGSYIKKINTFHNPSLTANWHENIKTSYFLPVIDGEPQKGTWGNYLTEENPFYFALPYRDFYYYVDGSEEPVRKDYYGVTDVKNKWIEISYIDNNEEVLVYAQWVDVGPWNYYDPYYVFEYQRPYAEIGIDMGWSSSGYRETNKAGLDVSPDVMEYLGEKTDQDLLTRGIIDVNWRFIEEEEVPEGPWKDKISTTAGDVKVFNLETQPLRTIEKE